MMRGLFLILSLLAPLSASAQSVQQSGTVTPGHAATWKAPGVIGDAGTAGGSAVANGEYLNTLGITGTGTPFCINDALTSAVGGYHQLCLGANALGGGLLSYQAYGGAASEPLDVNINGLTYPFVYPSVNGLPTVVSNAALKGLAAGAYATVYRAGYAVQGDGGAAYYTWSSTVCSLNSGAGDNGMQVKPNSGTGCWNAAVSPNCVPVTLYGINYTSGADNSAAIVAAVNAAGALGISCVQLPTGQFDAAAMSFSTYNNITFNCAAINGDDTTGGTVIRPTSLSENLFTFTSLSGIYFRGCSFKSPSQQTAGTMISYISSNSSGMRDFSIIGAYDAILLGGGNTGATDAMGSREIYFETGTVRNWANVAVRVQGGGDDYFSHLIMDQDSSAATPYACFYTEQSDGSITISDSDLLHCHYGFFGNPGSGQYVSWVYISNTFFDSGDFPSNQRGGVGIYITPNGGGIANGWNFQNVWASTFPVGIKIYGDSASTCTGMNFTNLQSIHNYGPAFVTGYCSNVSIVNPMIGANSQTGTGQFPGVDLVAGALTDSVFITGGTIGGPLDNYGVTQNYNILLDTGYQGLIAVDNTDLRGSTVASVGITSGVTADFRSHVNGSPGYNQQEPSILTVTASPFKVGPYLNTNYMGIAGGTVSSVTICCNNGTPITFATTTNVIIPLSPQEYATITYSAAPTVVLNGN